MVVFQDIFAVWLLFWIISRRLNVRISAPFYINEYLSSLNKHIVKGYKFRQIPKGTRKIFRIATCLLSMINIEKFQPEIIHETYFSSIAYSPKKSKRVITVHDMILEIFPDMFPQGKSVIRPKKKAIQRSDHIICVSKATRDDLVRYYSVPSNKISVIYHGLDTFAATPTTLNNEPFIQNQKPYLLYVGSRRGYKNFFNFLCAFAGSTWLKDNFKIIVFGGGKLDKNESHILNQLGLSRTHVIQVSGSDAKLRLCYQNAEAFIYPSIYEGFGLPIIEAMHYNCPVICSNTSSIPEVAGSAAEYFDPHDILSIKLSIEKVLNSNDRRIQLKNLGAEQSATFSWEKCAEKTFSVYQDLIANIDCFTGLYLS